ncbi:hypothetical protein ACP70R_036656 [Stipagrostis hirtigluma subsp. patula]
MARYSAEAERKSRAGGDGGRFRAEEAAAAAVWAAAASVGGWGAAAAHRAAAAGARRLSLGLRRGRGGRCVHVATRALRPLRDGAT